MFSSLNANHNGLIEYKGKLLNWFNLEIGLRMSSSFLRRWSRSGLYSEWVDHIFLSAERAKGLVKIDGKIEVKKILIILEGGGFLGI